MVTWHQNAVKRLWRDIGAGLVAASATLIASFLYLLVLMLIPLQISPDAQYWVGYAPQFGFVAGLVVGTVVWRRVLSRASTPEQGAFAGRAIAIGIVVLVPILAAMYVLLFPILLSVVNGQGLYHALKLYPAPLWAAVGVTQTVATVWTPLAGVLLIPIGALAGWAYQHRRRLNGW